MRISIALLTLVTSTLISQGTFAHNASYSKKREEASSSKKECGWNGSTSLRAGFSYSFIGTTFPASDSGETSLRGTGLDLSGPKVSLEQTVGYKGIFNLSFRGSLADNYCASTSARIDRTRGYIAEADGRLFVPFLINRKAKMHLSLMGGFGWKQTRIKSDIVEEAEEDNIENVKVRYLSPMAGLFFDLCPSKKSYANFGITFLFPRARQQIQDSTSLDIVTDHLRNRRHGWRAEYEYRYKLSRNLAFSARMQYEQSLVYGGLYSRSGDEDIGQARSNVYEKSVSGTMGFCFSY